MTYLYTALASAAAAGLLIWQVQTWRYDDRISKIVLTYAEARITAESDARAIERANATKTLKALNARTKKTVEIQAAHVGNLTELERLRDASRRAADLSSKSAAACAATTAAYDIVFTQCSAEAVELARTADNHAADVRVLLESRPVDGGEE